MYSHPWYVYSVAPVISDSVSFCGFCSSQDVKDTRAIPSNNPNIITNNNPTSGPSSFILGFVLITFFGFILIFFIPNKDNKNLKICQTKNPNFKEGVLIFYRLNNISISSCWGNISVLSFLVFV